MALFGPKRGFGLDISDYSIKVLELEKRHEKIEIRSFGRLEIPNKELVENGVIKEKEILIKSVKEVIAKSQPEKIKSRYVLFSLPESKVFHHIMELPVNLTFEQIREALSYTIESIFPYSINDLFVDFKIIQKKEKTQEIFLVASPKIIVNSFKEVLQKAGLIPIVFDLESISLARALIEKFEKGEGVIILDIGARTSIISVFDQLGLRFTTNIKLAGNRFNKEVAKALGGIPLPEAEKIKIKEGFLSEKFGQVLKETIKPLCQEIKKIIEYTEEKYGFKIKKIILAGGSSLLPGAPETFQSQIGLPTERGNPLIKLAKDNLLAKEKKNILFANVIGLALRALEKDPLKVDINLLKG
ncbi:MAG: type IV pilus assembly protein PilM [Patescibacteria group bacterium]